MFFDVVGVNASGAILSPAIEVFIDICNAVLPYFIFPFWRRQLVLQNTAVSVQRCGLTSLFVKSHLPQQVFDSTVDVSLRIFVNVLAAILI